MGTARHPPFTAEFEQKGREGRSSEANTADLSSSMSVPCAGDTAQDGRQCGREISGGILTGDVAGVEPDGLLDELVLCTVVVSRTHLFDELLCLRERFAVRT